MSHVLLIHDMVKRKKTKGNLWMTMISLSYDKLPRSLIMSYAKEIMIYAYNYVESQNLDL